MFPDSKFAEKMQLKPNKLEYVNHGIPPHEIWKNQVYTMSGLLYHLMSHLMK